MIHLRKPHKLHAPGAAILSGFLLILLFPPIEWSVVAWLALAPLLISLRQTKPSRAFRLGLLSGTVFYMGSLYWILPVLTDYGGIVLPAAIAVWLLLCAYLVFFIGLFAFLVCFFLSRLGSAGYVLAPFVWVALELARTYALTGFPWLILGTSLYRHPSLIQFAAYAGVYGISFLVVSFAAAVAAATNYGGRRGVSALALGIFVIVAMVTAPYLANRFRETEHETSEKVTFALLQGNVPQEAFFRGGADAPDIFLRHQALALPAAGVDLVVMAEACVPAIYEREPWYRVAMGQLAKDTQASLLFGTVGYAQENGDYRARNRALLLGRDGEPTDYYDKVHLVPFGEYVPLEKLLFFASPLVQAVSSFTAGEELETLTIPEAEFGVLICYEIIFPELSRRVSKMGAEFLVTITNDAWFGESAAPRQHFINAVFRAVENRRYVLRCANTGISGIIHPSGKILKETDLNAVALVRGELNLEDPPQLTWYTQHGDLFAFGCVLLTVGVVMSVLLISRKRRSSDS